MAAVKKLNALLLRWKYVWPSARPSAAGISASNIWSRKPSATISDWISHWKQQGAPWAIVLVKKLTAFLLMSESLSFSARPSAARISASNILSRKPSEIISAWIYRENNGAHPELWQQWKFLPRLSHRQNIYHLVVHAQARRRSWRQISCPESPLWLFQYEYSMKQEIEPWAMAEVKKSIALLRTV